MNDLPEPKRPIYSPLEKKQRRWNLLLTAFLVVGAYTQIHKVFVPLFLKMTSLAGTPYAQVDFWMVHSLLMIFILHRQKRLSLASAFLAGVGIAYAVVEAKLALQGAFTGWLVISRLLSSIPMGILCALLLGSATTRQLLFAWAGALLVAFAFIAESLLQSSAPVAATNGPIPQQTRAIPNVSCGAQSLMLVNEHPPASAIYIKDCGFEPSVIQAPSSSIEVINYRSSPINLHILHSDGTKKTNLTNLLIAPLEKRRLPSSPPGSVALLYSDSDPSAGIVGIWPESIEGEWHLSRKPIDIRRK